MIRWNCKVAPARRVGGGALPQRLLVSNEIEDAGLGKHRCKYYGSKKLKDKSLEKIPALLPVDRCLHLFFGREGGERADFPGQGGKSVLEQVKVKPKKECVAPWKTRYGYVDLFHHVLQFNAG
jgi:hypothetical protein